MTFLYKKIYYWVKKRRKHNFLSKEHKTFDVSFAKRLGNSWSKCEWLHFFREYSATTEFQTEIFNSSGWFVNLKWFLIDFHHMKHADFGFLRDSWSWTWIFSHFSCESHLIVGEFYWFSGHCFSFSINFGWFVKNAIVFDTI